MPSADTLTESDVIKAVSRHLRERGYVIEQESHGQQRGDDIVAGTLDGKRRLHVEAKGATPLRRRSRSRSRDNFGKPMSRMQRKTHTAEAFYKAAEIRQRPATPGLVKEVGLAFPKTKDHVEFVWRIRSSVFELGFKVYFVTGDHHVEEIDREALLPASLS